MKRGFWFFVCLLSLGIAASASAEEAQFGYVYTTDLLPKGKKEIEQWMTWRHQKSQGTFDVWEMRTALEYGVTDRFQASAYLNYTKARAFHDNVDGTTFPPESFAEAMPYADEHWSQTKFVGVSLEGIYTLLSPYKDPIGLAFYLEPTIGNGLRELESRLILQKNFFDDQLIVAANATVEQEGRYLPGDPAADPASEEANNHWDHETDVNFGLAASYRLMSNWYAGAEFQNEEEFSNFHLGSQNRTNFAYYLGPTVHYGGKRFFVTATFLTQLPGGKDFANPPPGFIVDGRNYADDFEKYRVRVKIGIPF